jgi:hypothetical protein
MKEILNTIDRIHKVNPTSIIRIKRVPGHKNAGVNEQADQGAKAAFTSSTTTPNTKMKSTQNRSIQSMAKTKWETEWETGRENARRLRNMSQYPGTTTILKLYGDLQQRKHGEWVAQPRTGRRHLNQYLHAFNIIETPECECDAETETVDHYLLNCELYDEYCRER